jgi:hypothetical protein
MSTNPVFGASGFGYGGFGNQPLEFLPLGYYMGLVSSEYTNSPKFNKLLYVLLRKFDDVTNCLISMDTAFDLDSAIGVQLDMLGVTAGAGRTVNFQPSGGVSPILDDGTYRILIKAKIAQNQWTGTLDSLYPIWKTMFPAGNIIIADNQNMTANIFVTGTFTSILQDLINHGYIVPRPEGVQYTYTFGALPAFGFDLNNAFVAGFDTGKWS